MAQPVHALVQVEAVLQPVVDARASAVATRCQVGLSRPLEPEQPHRIEQHRQRAELVIDDRGDRALARTSPPARASGHSQAVSTMPTALTPKAKTTMFCRMMRTVSRDSRHKQRQAAAAGRPWKHDVAGLGRHVGAAAADGQADVGAGQGRGVVDAVADHGHAAAAGGPACAQPRDELGLLLRAAARRGLR